MWDVVREHLDEATFFWRQRERTLLAPDYVLAEVAEGDERRLLAHITGLKAGGVLAAERVLAPVLEVEEDEAPLLSASAYALLAADASRWGPVVLQHFLGEDPEPRAALQKALELSPWQELDTQLRQAFPRLEPDLQALTLKLLRFRQADMRPLLSRLPPPESAPLLAAMIRVARFTSGPMTSELVRRGLDSPDAWCREAALETGLVLRLPAARSRCRQLLKTERPGRTVLTALAASGDRQSLAQLVDMLSEPRLRSEALWALGFSGRMEAAEAALQLIRNQGDGLAADTFRLITGAPFESLMLPPREEQGTEQPSDEEAEVSFLPAPSAPPGAVHVSLLEQWWREARPRFPPEGRYLLGRPWTSSAALSALLEVPMPRRPAIAWELAVRSAGMFHLEERAWCWWQFQQLRMASPPQVELGSQPFNGTWE